MKNLLSKEPIPTGQVLENVGYGEIIQDPKRITESEGFKQALAEIGLREALVAQGINPQKIASKIDELLEASDKDGNSDFTAIDKGLKHATAIYGITEQPKPPQNSTYNFIFSTETQAEIKEIEDKIKAKLTQNVPKDKETN